MDKKLIMGLAGLVAMLVLVVANFAWGYTQKQKRLVAEQTPLVSQQEMEKAAAIAAAAKEKAYQEAIANIKPIAPMPTPAPTPKPEKPKETEPSPGDDVTAEQPEYIKPTPPPAPTPTPSPKPGEVQPTPTPKPKPSNPQKGDTRTNENGDTEVFMGDFGWVLHAPGGTYEPAHNAGTGEVIGF